MLLSNDFDAAEQISNTVSEGVPEASDHSQWLRMTEQGHESFAESDFQCAHKHYENAMKEAVRLFGNAAEKGENASEALSVLLLASRNMADNLVHLGGFNEAVHVLRAVFGMLVDTIVNLEMPAAMRSACLQNLEHSLSVLISHIRFRVSHDPEVWGLVKELTATARGVLTFASRWQVQPTTH